MTNNHILQTLKKAAGNCRWSRKGDRFTAIFGGRGMTTTITKDTQRYQIVTKAMAMERELINAKKGVLDEQTEELWDRKTGKRVVTQAPLPTSPRHR